MSSGPNSCNVQRIFGHRVCYGYEWYGSGGVFVRAHDMARNDMKCGHPALPGARYCVINLSKQRVYYDEHAWYDVINRGLNITLRSLQFMRGQDCLH